LTITPKQQHLGKIRQGETRPFTFTVTNTSTETVEITDVEASCGCTAVVVAERILKPGASTQLTGMLAAENQLGEFGSTLLLKTKAGDSLQSLVGGHAVTLLVGPTHIDLGVTDLEESPVAQTFIFRTGNDDTPWDTLRVVGGDGLKSEVLQQ
jgi:hypothetical protein